MITVLKVISALLSYPTQSLQDASDELQKVITDDRSLSRGARRALLRLIDEIASEDLYELQARYVFLFDRTRSLSLHLFEHVHGESRDRGQAMIDLRNLYEQNGLTATPTELPDFLPMFLEFLATQRAKEARELLAQPAHVLGALAERLRKRQSSYETLFRALLELSQTKLNDQELIALQNEEDQDPNDLAALDAAWEEAAVTFGPNVSACKDGLVARMRAGRRPAATQA